MQANELLHGRLAMVGFAAAVMNQLRWGGVYGPGPLAQVRERWHSSESADRRPWLSFVRPLPSGPEGSIC
jgi:hypothetical protein